MHAVVNDGVAVTRGDGAIRLLGDFSSFEDERTSSDIYGHLVWSWCNFIFRHEQLFPLAPRSRGTFSGTFEKRILNRGSPANGLANYVGRFAAIQGRKEAGSTLRTERNDLHHEKLRH